MIVITLSFLAGRYHATPWGRHVNEGAVEWPPSPWRLLRSLIAVWKRTLPDVTEAEMKPIFETLGAAPPRFVLPPACTGHTRHYMPWYKKGPTDRTLVFDTFVSLDPNEASGAVHVIWLDATLDDAKRRLLERLLGNLNFLGRAESWCEARLLCGDEEQAVCHAGNDEALLHAVPIGPDQPKNCPATPRERDRGELVRTLCADPATAFGNAHFYTQKEKKQGKNTTTATIRTAAPYDPDWHIAAETLWLHDQKWSDPPGSRWVTYTRPRNCFEVVPASVSRPTRKGVEGVDRSIHIARFALDSAVLPLVTDTLPVAEAARSALLCRYANSQGRVEHGERWNYDTHKEGRMPITPSYVLLGRAPLEPGSLREDGCERSKPFWSRQVGGPARDGHRHAYYLLSDEDGDGRLDHLTVYAAAGFGAEELRALQELRRIRYADDRHPLRTVLLGTSASVSATGSVHDDPFGRSPFGCSEVWVSATPYLVTRHAKNRGPNRVDLRDPAALHRFLVDDLMAQLRSARTDLPSSVLDQVQIEQCVDRGGQPIVPAGSRMSGPLRLRQFARKRCKRTDDGNVRMASAWRLIFRTPVRGPFVLGHSSHFGLGLFLPGR